MFAQVARVEQVLAEQGGVGRQVTHRYVEVPDAGEGGESDGDGYTAEMKSH